MGNCTVQDWNLSQVLLSCLYAFGNSSGNFTGFSKPPTNNTFLITYHYNCRKAKGSSTFCYFGYAIDCNQTIF